MRESGAQNEAGAGELGWGGGSSGPTDAFC